MRHELPQYEWGDVSEYMTVVDPATLRWTKYDELDVSLRQQAEQATIEIRERSQRLTTDLIEIGQRLIEMKQVMRGFFTEWLDAEFGYGTTIARQYIAIAERFSDNPELAALFGSTSLRLASSHELDDDEVLELAERAKAEGRTVKVAEVQQAKREHKLRVGIGKKVAMPVVEVAGGRAGEPERGEGGPPLGRATRKLVTVTLEVEFRDKLLEILHDGLLMARFTAKEHKRLIAELESGVEVQP